MQQEVVEEMNTNRERYTNSKERIVVFGVKCIDCKTAERGDCNKSVAIACFNNWLDEKDSNCDILPCPFCGGTTEVIKDEQGYYGVSCIHCDYTSERYEQYIYAIAAHNRVASAVEAIKKGVK